MNKHTEFSEYELTLIKVAKKTLKILAKVIEDKKRKEVIKDQDLAELIGDRDLAEALEDPVLTQMIEERVTPDLSQLNPNEEAMVIGQLGSKIFGELMGLEKSE